MIRLKPARYERTVLEDERLQPLYGMSFEETWPHVLAVWSAAKSLAVGPVGFPGTLLEEYLLVVHLKYRHGDSCHRLFRELGQHGAVVDAYIVETLGELGSPLLRDLPASVLDNDTILPRLYGCSCAPVALGSQAKEVREIYLRDHPAIDCQRCQQSFECALELAVEFQYAYCADCGMPVLVESTDDHSWGKIDTAHMSSLPLCHCGGSYENGATPKCPHCRSSLSPEDLKHKFNLDVIGNWDKECFLVLNHQYRLLRVHGGT